MKILLNKHKAAAGMLVFAMILGMIFSSMRVNASAIVGPAPVEGSLEIIKTDGKEPLDGAVFTLYKIMDLTSGAAAGDYASYSPTDTYEDALDNISPDTLGNYSTEELESLIATLLPLTLSDTGIVMDETEDGETKQEGLALGYYLVVETTTPSGYIAGNPFFVAIPSTDNYNKADQGTEWVYDVTVAPKNKTVTIDKDINTGTAENENLQSKSTVSVGDDVPFVVETAVPKFESEYFEGTNVPVFEITDTMSIGLKYNRDMKIFVVDESGTEEEVLTALDKWVQSGITDSGFKITFAKAFLQTYAEYGVKLYYSAEITDDVVVGPAGDNTNSVVLSYSNNPQDKTSKGNKGDETEVYSFSIAIEKYGIENSATKGLAGAEFALYKDAACTDPVFTSGTYETNNDGKVSFDQIKAGTYYIKETKSPTGYKLLTNPIKVTITATSTDGELDGGFTLTVNDQAVTEDEGTFVTRLDVETGVATVAIKNNKGFTLPVTGGLGIAVFMIIGMIGLIFLSFTLVKRKRVS